MQELFVLRIGGKTFRINELHVAFASAVGLGLLAVAALQ